jgi:aromatic-L-amino-acid decarboxylase
VRDFNEYQPQLGRRFRALKIWFVLRYFGLEGIRRRLSTHVDLAQGFRARVEAEPDAEVLAPSPFATVCFRWRPRAFAGREGEADVETALAGLNQQLMEAVNATGEVFISHTRLRDRFTLRLALGGIRTEARHVDRAWALVAEHGRRLAAEAPTATVAQRFDTTGG